MHSKTFTDYIFTWQAFTGSSALCLIILFSIPTLSQLSPVILVGSSLFLPGLAIGIIYVMGSGFVALYLLLYSMLKEAFSSKKGVLYLLLFCVVVYLAGCPFIEDKHDPYEAEREYYQR